MSYDYLSTHYIIKKKKNYSKKNLANQPFFNLIKGNYHRILLSEKKIIKINNSKF